MILDNKYKKLSIITIVISSFCILSASFIMVLLVLLFFASSVPKTTDDLLKIPIFIVAVISSTSSSILLPMWIMILLYHKNLINQWLVLSIGIFTIICGIPPLTFFPIGIPILTIGIIMTRDAIKNIKNNKNNFKNDLLLIEDISNKEIINYMPEDDNDVVFDFDINKFSHLSLSKEFLPELGIYNFLNTNLANIGKDYFEKDLMNNNNTPIITTSTYDFR